MNLHWLAHCTHLMFVVDRIENTYAVIEWAHSAMLEDIHQAEFPRKPREGQIWTVHIKTRPTRKMYTTGFDWDLVKEHQERLRPKLRLAQTTKPQKQP